MTSFVTQDSAEGLASLPGGSTVTQDSLEGLGGFGTVVTQDSMEGLGGFNFVAPSLFHGRIGRSFEINASFMLPPEEKLYEQPSKGSAAPATPDSTFNPPHGYDEGLDDCFTIIQKGGDRTAPMSWALAVVNIGSGSGITPPTPRVSNYALCWIWFDAPGWGSNVPGTMKYNLSTLENPVAGTHAQFSTQALRALVIHKYIEPGRRYSVAVQLQRDTGTPGSSTANTAWNFDGYFKVWVTTDDSDPEVFSLVDSGGGVTASGIEVYKGPQDSGSYFIKYGVRYSARDAMYWGLGFRPHVWKKAGFIPWGADAAPIQNGGYRMIDRSANTVAGIYGGGIHSLTGTKNALGDAYVEINHRGFANSNTNGGTAPMGFWGGANYLQWDGLDSAGVGGQPYNPEALRGYRLVTTGDFNAGAPLAKGAVFSILSYTDVGLGGPFRVSILNGNTIGTFTTQPLLVQAFRWNQRELILSEFRIWKQPRNYADTDAINAARRKLSLRSGLEIDDKTEPDTENLLARWAGDDAEGAVIRETVIEGRRNGYFAPFGVGVGSGGTRGEKVVFLSGEGEAIKIDFSSNPVVQKLIEENLASGTQGFGFEITCMFPEAFYAIQGPGEQLPDGGVTNGSRPRFVPDVVTWDVPDPEGSGAKSVPRTILSLTHRALRNDENQNPFVNAVPWSVEVANRSDQENSDAVVHSDLLPWFVATGIDFSRYDRNAAWVGKFITIQVGIQPVVGGSGDQYDVYIAMRPKTAINPASGDAGDVEFTYWSAGTQTYDTNPAYFTSAHITVRAKDLVRSVVTVGGRWSPRSPQSGSQGVGYSELNCRMILDEVRIFGCSPSGSLPATNGGSLARDGKLIGLKCLPARELTADDLTLPLGRGLEQANVTDSSVSVIPAGGGKFFTSESAATIESVKGAAFTVKGDDRTISEPDTVPETQQDLYRVTAVAADGSSLTISRPFRGATRGAAAAGIVRLLYYSAFGDDLGQKDLSLGAGSVYDPATSTIANATMVDDLWKNVAPINVHAGLRIYSPLGRGTLKELLPTWDRGVVTPRRNPILGVQGRNGDLFCATQGSIYQADDRWRQDGPSNDITTSLAFLGKELPGTSIISPLHGDRVEFRSPAGNIFTSPIAYTTSATDDYATSYDIWVKLDGVHDYQTAVFVGNPGTDPSLAAGSTGHVAHLIIRFRRGVPEFVFGSIGIPVTEKGLYIASGSTAIPAGTWTHIRWTLASRFGGLIVKVPDLKVNGRSSGVTVNAQDTNIGLLDSIQASDWLTYADIVQPGNDGKIVLGVARDSYRLPEDTPSISGGVQQIVPQRIQGWLHGLSGSLAEVAVTHQTPWTGSQTGAAAPVFDPYAIDYNAALSNEFHALGAGAEGVGHKVVDTASSKVGVIKASPFRSVYHEFGRSSLAAAWAQFGQQLYVTNGGKPVVIIKGSGRSAGVIPPGIKPEFVIQRFPVWEPNVRDKTTAANPANDPLNAAAPNADPINHYRTTGNAYFRQELSSADSTEFAWTKDRYFAFKCYWKPEAVSGRISIWRRGQSKDAGGPFVECRDGKCSFGWYDTFLKKEVSVTTDAPVFIPGRVHLIYIRKRFPQADLLEGNWVNSYYSDATVRRINTSAGSGSFTIGETITGGTSGATGRVLRYVQATATQVGFIEYAKVSANFSVSENITGGTSGASATSSSPTGLIAPMNDMMVVRALRTTAPTTATLTNLDETDAATFVTRNSVSFTTEVAQVRPAGTTATGLVTHIGTTYKTFAANPGVVFATVGNPFLPQMIGMYFQFGSGPTAGVLYRVSGHLSPSQITVVLAGTTTVPTFTDQTLLVGGVFSGIALVKSADFDSSKGPELKGDVDFLGGEVQADPLTGFTAHAGAMWCPGWTSVDPSSPGQNAPVFEDADASASGTIDPCDIGSDRLEQPLYKGSAGDCGELHFNGTTGVNEPAIPDATFWTTDSQTYNAQGGNASSQPNGSKTDAPFIDKTATSSPRTTASKAANPKLRFLQNPTEWSGKRFIATAFYDPIQDAVSNPGPTLTIAPSDEEVKNPSGSIRFLLTGLPQRRGHELWIFESLSDGDEATMFRVARFDASAYSFGIQSAEEQISLGPPLEFSNFAPPECKVLASTGTRIMYGALTALKQLDGVMYSQAGRPVSLKITTTVGFFRVSSGFGDEITGMDQLDEIIIIGKDHGLASATIDGNDLAHVGTLSGGVGIIAPASLKAIDDRAYFLSERGVHMVTRAGVTNLGVPTNISGSLEEYFSFRIDKRYARSFVAAVNRQRDQYVILTREMGETRARTRISTETYVRQNLAGTLERSLSPASHRFSRYDGPDLTAIGGFQSTPGGVEKFVGGTLDGFLLWLDRDDTQTLGLGAATGIYGSPILDGDVGSSLIGIVAAGSVDDDLEGPRGVPLRYLDANGVEVDVTALGSSGQVILLDEQVAAALPSAGVLMAGVQEHRIETPWMDMGNPEREKLLHYLNLIFRSEPSGSIKVDFYSDLDAATAKGGVARAGQVEPLSRVLHQIVGNAIPGRWFKAVITIPFGVANTKFELVSAVWRVDDIDQD